MQRQFIVKSDESESFEFKLAKAIENNDHNALAICIEKLKITSSTIIRFQDQPYSLIEFVMTFGDASTLKYVLEKNEFKKTSFSESFFSKLFNFGPDVRIVALEWLRQNHLPILQQEYHLTEKHILAAMGDISGLDDPIENQPKDKNELTPLHYAALSGYGVTKDKRIIEALNHNNHYLIPTGNNKGLSIELCLFRAKAFDALETLIDSPLYNLNSKTYYAYIDTPSHAFYQADFFYLLAAEKLWYLINKILLKDKTAIVNLSFIPPNLPVNFLMLALEAKQWDLILECLKRDKKDFILGNNAKICDLPIEEYLIKENQLELLKILKDRHERIRSLIINTAKENSTKRAKTLTLNDELALHIDEARDSVTLSDIKAYIERGADPTLPCSDDSLSILQAAIATERLDIVKYLICEKNVKLELAKPNILLHILKTSADFRKQAYTWLLDNEKYWQDSKDFNRNHILAALGKYPLKMQDIQSPEDNMGLSYFHYALMSGVEINDNADAIIKVLESIPVDKKERDRVAKGCSALLWLSINDLEDRIQIILEKIPNYIFNYNALSIEDGSKSITLFNNLIVQGRFDLAKNLYKRSPTPILNPIIMPNEDRRYATTLSLFLAEGDIDLFEEIAKVNHSRFNNLNEAHAIGHPYEGITLAWLLAYHQKWDLLKELYESKQPHLVINLNARPNNRTKYGSRSLRDMLKNNGQKELLKLFSESGSQYKPVKVKKVSPEIKPVLPTIEKKDPTKQEQIEDKIYSILDKDIFHIEFVKANKKLRIIFNYRGNLETADKDNVKKFKSLKDQFIKNLRAAKNIKGNESLTIDKEEALCGSEGALFSFFQKQQIIDKLKEVSPSATPNDTSTTLIDDYERIPRQLDDTCRNQWRDALLPAFCHAIRKEDIQWDAEAKCFKIEIKKGPWHVRNFKAPHKKSKAYELGMDFIDNQIVSKLDTTLSKKNEKTLSWGKAELKGNIIHITPYIDAIPLLTDLQQNLYKEISKQPEVQVVDTNTQEEEETEAANTGKEEEEEEEVAEEEEGEDSTPINQETKTDSEDEGKTYDLNVDGILPILKAITPKGTEFKFLVEPKYYYKNGEITKIIYEYTYSGAPTVNTTDSKQLLLACKNCFDTTAPGFMNVYDNMPAITVVFNLTKAKSLFLAEEIKQMKNTVVDEISKLKTMPATQTLVHVATPETVDSKPEIKTSKPKKKKKKKKKSQTEVTEATVFNTIKGPIQNLSTNKQENIATHLAALKELPQEVNENVKEYFNLIRLLHSMRILGILGFGAIKESDYYKFRNVFRHAVDEMENDRNCAFLCEQVTPFIEILEKQFEPARITNVSVSFFSTTKCNALEALKEAVKPFEKELEDRTVGEHKNVEACLTIYRELLSELPNVKLSDNSELDRKWKRDVRHILRSLIEEILHDGTYGEIYGKIGHEFEVNYNDFADSLDQEDLTVTTGIQARTTRR